MNYRLKYETSSLVFGSGGHPSIVIETDRKFYKYSRNPDAGAYGLTTYNPTGAAIPVESYDLYYPVTTALPQVNSVRVFVAEYDVTTGVISNTTSKQLIELTRSETMDDSLPATITADGTVFYRHHMVAPDGNSFAIPLGWCAQVFYAHNFADYDEWDDNNNTIYPLCSSEYGAAATDGTHIYTGIVTKSSTTSYVRRTAGASYRKNFEEIMTYPADPPVYPNTEDKWCAPTAENVGIKSRFNIFPYIHMNGVHL